MLHETHFLTENRAPQAFRLPTPPMNTLSHRQVGRPSLKKRPPYFCRNVAAALSAICQPNPREVYREVVEEGDLRHLAYAAVGFDDKGKAFWLKSIHAKKEIGASAPIGVMNSVEDIEFLDKAAALLSKMNCAMFDRSFMNPAWIDVLFWEAIIDARAHKIDPTYIRAFWLRAKPEVRDAVRGWIEANCQPQRLALSLPANHDDKTDDARQVRSGYYSVRGVLSLLPHIQKPLRFPGEAIAEA